MTVVDYYRSPGRDNHWVSTVQLNSKLSGLGHCFLHYRQPGGGVVLLLHIFCFLKPWWTPANLRGIIAKMNGLIFQIKPRSSSYSDAHFHPVNTKPSIHSPPQEHVKYIQANIPVSTKRKDLPFPPVLKMITSVPVLALMCTNVVNAWSYWTLSTATPTYLNNVQHFSLELVSHIFFHWWICYPDNINALIFQNGLVSALPNVVTLLLSFFVGFSADKVMNSGKLSTGSVRKIYNSISLYGGALGLIMLAYSNCNKVMAVVALCIANGFRAFIFGGFVVSNCLCLDHYNRETDFVPWVMTIYH